MGDWDDGGDEVGDGVQLICSLVRMVLMYLLSLVQGARMKTPSGERILCLPALAV